ncbi:MAG TPA: AMP-binding protein [Leptolyngbyaceae cyanobacterium M65_K2018_010]|nr:AMP-binding protein [Leptolyngbyaceae cyanobacterium M65_K2018_010]
MGQPVARSAPLSLDALLHQRWGENWLVGGASPSFWRALEQFGHRLESARRTGSQTAEPLVVMAEPNPLKGLGAILASHRLGYTVALANPQWGQQEWQQVEAILQVDRRHPLAENWACYLGTTPAPSGHPEFLIPTGGSSGQIRFARHRWTTLMASVEGFRAHFGVNRVHAYCLLPIYHVSGLMQGLRAFTSGGQMAIHPYHSLKQGQCLPLPEQGFLSLVPTQLQWLLNQAPSYWAWLRGFRAVLLGGAPAWPSLLDRARALGLPLAPTYGMTETASQVATLLPEEFLAGHSSCGRPLPHAQIRILNGAGAEQPPGQPGALAIAGPSLFLGYLSLVPQAPPSPTPQVFLSEDIGYFDPQGYLHLQGRRNTQIITGGEKVFPEEVEAALLATQPVQEVCVVGLPDQQWGQRICALLVLRSGFSPLEALPHLLQQQLTAYKRPKCWVVVAALPKSAQGKINRSQALALAQAVLNG